MKLIAERQPSKLKHLLEVSNIVLLVVWTLWGKNKSINVILEPDPLPGEPVILERNGTTMKVSVPEAINNNGPVTFYRLVVMIINDEFQLEFDEALLGSYNRSVDNGVPYYVTAQFPYQVSMGFSALHFMIYDDSHMKYSWFSFTRAFKVYVYD